MAVQCKTALLRENQMVLLVIIDIYNLVYISNGGTLGWVG